MKINILTTSSVIYQLVISALMYLKVTKSFVQKGTQMSFLRVYDWE